jgi:hypothetical protein
LQPGDGGTGEAAPFEGVLTLGAGAPQSYERQGQAGEPKGRRDRGGYHEDPVLELLVVPVEEVDGGTASEEEAEQGHADGNQSEELAHICDVPESGANATNAGVGGG